LRIETLWAAGRAKIVPTYVRAGDLDLLRDRLTLAVNAATDTPELAIPGWWCPTCRFAHRCPAIAQDSAEQLLSRFDVLTQHEAIDHFNPAAVAGKANKSGSEAPGAKSTISPMFEGSFDEPF
jgi:hypothetical protein